MEPHHASGILALCRNPITGRAGCCARAASGHATAAPPNSVMNSHLFTRSFVANLHPGRQQVFQRVSTCGVRIGVAVDVPPLRSRRGDLVEDLRRLARMAVR